jgi:hypothetical protein
MTRHNKQIERRQFLRGALTTAGALVAAPELPRLFSGINARVLAAKGQGSYGALVPTPDLRDGVTRMALPEGFQYRSFSVSGTPMSDGNLAPLAHDGMGVFNMPEGRFRLVRNHEDRNPPGQGSTRPDAKAYDPMGGGGTTTLVINPFTRELERDFISLSGTIVNCAGGITPWGTWITCEETNAGAPTWPRQHGYCFEVPAAADGRVEALPIPAMGRFSHEAVAVDPNTWIVYETEDNSSGGGSSGFYRFVPANPGVLTDGGRLEMMAIDGVPQYDARNNQTVGVSLPVTWVPIADPNPPGTSSMAVFGQGRALGGARFRRLEGCWWGNGAVYFNDTSGGNAGFGTVWEFRPQGDGGTLTLIFESSGQSQLDFPDNLTVSPQGSLLLCEDGGGEQYLRGLTVEGGLFDFAKNLMNDAEWAGATFAEASPAWNARAIRGNQRPLGGRWERVTLFVNLLGTTRGPNPPAPGNEGLTFAIWGPWGEGAL